ncbi:MAG: sulfurtransferase TusA family protein, partial [Candidatus Margulisiibacteriota bacterium]
WTLPRKFKVAFSGSTEDKGLAKVADVGFIATTQGGQRGFIVYVAGGLGAKSDVSKKLFDFIPDSQVYAVVHAVKLLFWKQGNRKNKHAARLRFLWTKLGEEVFIRTFQEYFQLAKDRPPLNLPLIENHAADVPSLIRPSVQDKKDYTLWKKRFVSTQKQPQHVSILVPIEFGFLDHTFTAKLALFLEPFGENTLRFTKNQNMIIRNIHEKYLPAVYQFLLDNQANFNRPAILDTLISCAGASTCQLGLCLSRGAAKAVIDRLQSSSLPLDELADVRIHFSGCPNSCGQHPIADLGFFGKAGRQKGIIFPAYNVVAGARIGKGDRAQLAEVVGEISAKDVPSLIEESLAAFCKAGMTREFWQGNGKETVSRLCETHSPIPDVETNADYYTDWTADKPFSLAGRGAGECSAGFFDLIDVDNTRLDEAFSSIDRDPSQAETAYNIALYACRMLLITRAEEPKTDDEVFRQFQKHFIDTALVNESFLSIVALGIGHQSKELLAELDLLRDLAKAVKQLYESMDTAFQFSITQKPKIVHSEKVVFKDFRGVACPMNFVKTKMELSKLSTGDRLEILLDDGEPIDNVPGSVRSEGHKVLQQEKVDQHWAVLIEKG